MKTKGMTGAMALWCDTSAPWPIHRKPMKRAFTDEYLVRLFQEVKAEKMVVELHLKKPNLLNAGAIPASPKGNSFALVRS